MSLSLPPDSPAENRLKWVHRCSLILWEQDYGIISGELDTTLEKSKTLRLSLLESLISIGKTLTGKIIMLLNQADDMSQSREALTLVLHEAEIYIQNDYEESSVLSDGDSDASSTVCDDWLDIADDLWTDVQCLLDLQPIIETPVLTIAAKSNMSKPQWAELKPHTAYTDKISNRYPEADLKLVDRLARGNWVRFLETKSSRDQNLSLGWVKGTINETQGKTKPPISEHPSTFHDSGIGSSAPSLSLYAETVMSYHQSERESVRVPPLPEGAKNGMPFDCIACGRNLMIRSNKRWKKHLYSDLHPWMCLDLQCNFGETAFEKRQDWVDHLALDHKLANDWKGFSCPLCHEALDDGQDNITRHLSAHMEEISLSAIPAAVESDHDSDSTSDTSDDEVKPAGRTLMRVRPSIAEPNNLGPFRNRKKITHEQWEAKRPIIADLYVRRQMTLKEVMKRLESNYGFIAA
ncbi:unnamed protein product [Clonostachys solani]|uniref:C2H2-type domain-containing protein n=1 Tax=Clonostachys solani TaxID=160281 RepID=A0A9N9YWG2_9HYPO|nr:unnamed protein product [Clonostachys solani]